MVTSLLINKPFKNFKKKLRTEGEKMNIMSVYVLIDRKETVSGEKT